MGVGINIQPPRREVGETFHISTRGGGAGYFLLRYKDDEFVKFDAENYCCAYFQEQQVRVARELWHIVHLCSMTGKVKTLSL